MQKKTFHVISFLQKRIMGQILSLCSEWGNWRLPPKAAVPNLWGNNSENLMKASAQKKCHTAETQNTTWNFKSQGPSETHLLIAR